MRNDELRDMRARMGSAMDAFVDAIEDGRPRVEAARAVVAAMPTDMLAQVSEESVCGVAFHVVAVAERVKGMTRDDLLRMMGEIWDFFAAMSPEDQP